MRCAHRGGKNKGAKCHLLYLLLLILNSDYSLLCLHSMPTKQYLAVRCQCIRPYIALYISHIFFVVDHLEYSSKVCTTDFVLRLSLVVVGAICEYAF